MITNLWEQISSKRILVSMASTLCLASAGFAQDTNGPTAMKPTVVTGSYIPTAETVGATPVQTVGAVEIQQSGTEDTLLTLKRAVPGFTGAGNYLGSVNNNVIIASGQLSFAGESYVALRNLPTLVLLDGHRITTSPFSAGQAIDLNALPLSMIERIEVLKDGASAIYGSDAIGGVINIITKKNYSGFEIGSRVGVPTESPHDHGLQYEVHMFAGISTDKTKFTAGAQLFDQNWVVANDRPIASMDIFELAKHGLLPNAQISPSYPGRVQAGGVSYILAGSPFAAGAPGYIPGLNTPPVFSGQTFSGSQAVVNYDAYAATHGFTVNGVTYHQAPYIPLSTTPSGELLNTILPPPPGGPENLYQALNTTDFGSTSILQQNRRNFFASFEHELFEHVTVYSSFLYSDDTARGQLAPSPVVRLYDGSSYKIGVPADNPYNPFGIDLGLNGASTPRIRSRFVDSGNRDFQTFTDFYDFLGGLKGDIAPGYTYDLSYTYSQDRQEQQTRNAINGAALNEALTPIGSVDAQGRPLSQLIDANGNNLPVYNFFGASLTPGLSGNARETLEQISTTQFQWGRGDLWNARGVFNGRVFALPAGDLSFAAGGEFQRETLSLQIDGLTKQGLIPGLNPAFDFNGGQRDTAAGFIEVNIPILGKDQDIPGFHSLEVTAAGRYQVFDPGGNSTVPKIAVRWQPLDEQLTLRGSYGQGFIAPAIYNLFGPDSFNNPVVSLGGVSGQVTVQTRQNPNLKPSDSDQWSAGVVFSPKALKNLTLSVDFYDVTVNHLPIADAQTAANSLYDLGPASPYFPNFSGTTTDGAPITGAHQVSVDGWNNLIIPWTGSAAIRTYGLDFGGNYVLPTPEQFGKFTLSAVANLDLSYQYQTSPAHPFIEYKGTYTILQGLIPDFTLTTSLGYEYQGWSAILTASYLPGVIDPGLRFAEYAGPNPLPPEQGGPTQGQTISGHEWHVDSYYRLDFQLAYEFGKGKVEGRSWYDGTRVAVGVNNFTDQKPPIIASSQEDNTDKNNYDLLGRFVYLELSKKF